MRIIAGRLGGRQFDSPKGHRTHPMSEKVRGALFSSLGDISGLTVLDAFAGSGALSFEALSRGAVSSVAVDVDKRAISTIVKSVADLGLQGSIKVIQANISSWSAKNTDQLFDIVLLDPPYDAVKPELLQRLAAHAKSGGLIVYSLPPDIELNLTSIPMHRSGPRLNVGAVYLLLSTKPYGDAQLVFYRKLRVES